MVEIGARFMDKVVEHAAAAAAEDDDEGVAGSVDGDEAEMEPVEPMPEPPDDAGPVGWPMPDFCPLTIDGAVKESFLETLRKEEEQDAERLPGEPEAAPSPDSRPSSSKRHRAGTASPSSSSRSPYRSMMQVFQECKQDVA